MSELVFLSRFFEKFVRNRMWLLEALKEKQHCDVLAMIHREKSISYRELWAQSENLATWMNGNLQSKNPVVIYGNKDIEILVVMVAALKTGRAYVPVDISFPVDRLERIVEMTEAELVFNFSHAPVGKRHCQTLTRYFDFEEFHEIIASVTETATRESQWLKDDDNCYILFTSGSTGQPKGVQITKKNIMNFVTWFQDYALDNGCSGGIALNQVSYSFDVSVIQLYIYLANGVTLFNIDKDMIDDFGLLFQYLGMSHINYWVSTPAFIEMCAVYSSFPFRRILRTYSRTIK